MMMWAVVECVYSSEASVMIPAFPCLCHVVNVAIWRYMSIAVVLVVG